MATASKGKTFIYIILAAVLVAASIGGTLYFQDRVGLPSASANNQEPVSEPVVLPDPLFTSLDPFTVSLRDENGSRVLYVGITLRVQNQESQDLLANYMPEVRDRVLRVLTKLSTRQVQAPNGREVLADELLNELTQPYLPHTDGPRISRVLFTAYVVQ